MDDNLTAARATLKRLALNEHAKACVMSNQLLYKVLFAAARPYIGGEKRVEAIAVANQLSRIGHKVTIDYMGKSTRDRNVAEAAAVEFNLLADDLATSKLDASVSLDLSHLGLVIDPTLAIGHLVSLAKRLAATNRDIIVSAEEPDRVDGVLSAAKLALEIQPNIGVTVQAYLPRTLSDVEMLLAIPPSLIRVVKGAFTPPLGAIQRGQLLNEAYLKIVKTVLHSDTRVSVATHDPELVSAIVAAVETGALDRSLIQFEFLAGIVENQLKRLSERGFSTRVYVTYGEEWFLYLCDRLAEYPLSLIPAFVRAMEVAQSLSA